jgi:hypothetical protein
MPEDVGRAEAKFQAGTRFHPYVWEAGKNSAARIAELEIENERLRGALASIQDIAMLARRALGGEP